MKLVFTSLARGDLVRLRKFAAVKNPEAAKRAALRIKKVANLIAERPLIGRAVNSPEGLREDIREFPLVFGTSGYLIRYQILPDQLRILRIWHAREGRK